MTDAAFRATVAQGRSQAATPFRRGEFVVYPAHGVGQIAYIGTEVISGHPLNMIRVFFAEARMTLHIPVGQACASGLRKLATHQVLTGAMTTLSGAPRASRLPWIKRGPAYQAKINSGAVPALAEVVRDLQAAGDGPHSSFSQRVLFESAVSLLAAEWAAVFGTENAEARNHITQALRLAGSAESSDQANQPRQSAST